MTLSALKWPGVSTRSTLDVEDVAILHTWRDAINSRATYYVAASDATDVASTATAYTCDGTADDVQIQAAIDAIEATGLGGTVQLSDGTFNISSSITINAANIQVKGRGKETIIESDWLGTGASLDRLFEITGVDDNNRISNCSISHINFQSDAPYDTTPDGLIGDGVLTAIYAQYVDHFAAHNLYATRISFMTDVRNATDVVISRLTGLEIFGAVSLVKVERSTVSDITVELAETIVDYGACQYGTCTNLVGKASTARNTDEAIDCGGSQQIAVSNVSANGFKNGMLIKYEAGVVAEPAEITVTNFVSNGHTASGIRVDNISQTGTRMGPVTIQGCAFVSAESGSAGVTCVNNYTEVTVANNHIDVDGIGITLDGCTDSMIIGNRVKSAASIGIRATKSATPTVESLLIAGNHILDCGTWGIFLNGTLDPVIESNTLEDIADDGIWVYESRYPVICNNTLRRIGDSGIRVEYNSDTYLDSTARYINLRIDGNHIQDWATTTAGQRAIWCEFTTLTGDSYDVLSICNNTIIATTAGETTVNAIRLESPVNFDYIMVCNNTLSPNLSNDLVVTGGAALEVNVKVKDNIGIADV